MPIGTVTFFATGSTTPAVASIASGAFPIAPFVAVVHLPGFGLRHVALPPPSALTYAPAMNW